MDSWQNGTRCGDGVKGHSHLVWLQNCAKIKKFNFTCTNLLEYKNYRIFLEMGGVQINRVFVRGTNTLV